MEFLKLISASRLLRLKASLHSARQLRLGRPLLVLLGFLLFCIGHLAIWCTIFNQIHATRCPKSARRGSEMLTAINVLLLGLVGLFLALVYPNLLDIRNFTQVFSQAGDGLDGWLTRIFVGYWHFCGLTALLFIGRWTYWRLTDRKPKFWTHHQWTDMDLDDDDPDLLHGLPTQLAYALVPGNQLLSLRVEDKTFEFANLPAALDGLKIVHLSDMHFTGRIGKGYFQQIVALSNQWQPDVVCITGDLLDKRKCLDWIDDTYGQLQARHGVYYILGNHDRRVKDEKGLRQQLQQAGMIDVNGRWQPVPLSRNGTSGTLWLAGNELPWFSGAQSLSHVDDLTQVDARQLVEGQSGDRQTSFFVALCHSPDQMNWSRQRGFDLMLAGHTHGGQVRLPVVGPVLAPSRYGVRYASGVFQIGPMALQVSRGISGADPLRWNCPPELCRLTLRCSPSSC